MQCKPGEPEPELLQGVAPLPDFEELELGARPRHSCMKKAKAPLPTLALSSFWTGSAPRLGAAL